MRGFGNRLSPAILVAAFSPLFFILAPDGIPHAFATCGVGAGMSAQNSTVNQCTDCSSNSGGYDNVDLISCSASGSDDRCELSVSVTLTMSWPDSDGCALKWNTGCHDGQSFDRCNNLEVAAQAPVTNYTVGWTEGCQTDGDVVSIELFTFLCNCSIGTGGGTTVFRATATCVGT